MRKNRIQQKIMIFIMVIIITAGLIPGGTVAVQAAGDVSNPAIGQISLFPYNRAPLGWMPCDGRSLSVAQYQSLYDLIGNAFGGNATNFNLPNLSTKAPITGTKYYIAVEGLYGIDNSAPAIGEVCLLPDSIVPADSDMWKLCDGTALSSTAYPTLYSLITTTYGGTATDFKIPNLSTKNPISGVSYYIATFGLYPSASGIGNEPYLGAIELYAFSFVPQDTINCNGQSIAISGNQALFSLIGYTFGGSGSSFAVPNLSYSLPSMKMKYCMRSVGLYPSFD
ncbi:MAG TPA: phage tail protein [Mobilitalea sp.]|nr:phage tail protein [Mobilitalea sp.]